MYVLSVCACVWVVRSRVCVLCMWVMYVYVFTRLSRVVALLTTISEA